MNSPNASPTAFSATRWSSAEGYAAVRDGLCIAVLDHLTCIDVIGPDAIGFLHNQLTQDVSGQAADIARLSGYCHAKGRLLATLLQWPLTEASAVYGMRLLLPREIAAGIAKRLGMFVLRAKVRVIDRSGEVLVHGLCVPAEKPLPEEFADALPKEILGLGTTGPLTWIRVGNADGMRRWIGVALREQATEAWPTSDSQITRIDAAVWRWTEIRAGVPQVLAATQEKFVPQMINFELIGGVNFRKGCYPGQEVVARSQYLGKLKRRMFLVSSIGFGPPPEAGSDVVTLHSTAPVGMVVNAEANADGGFDALIETTLTASESALLVGGVAVRLGALPYSLPIESASPA